MNPPPGWQNPITVQPGAFQHGVDPCALLPGRNNLHKARLDFQRGLIQAGKRRLTPILVTKDGVIYDGHHAARAAAEEGVRVDILVIDQTIPATAQSILHLPVG